MTDYYNELFAAMRELEAVKQQLADRQAEMMELEQELLEHRQRQAEPLAAVDARVQGEVQP